MKTVLTIAGSDCSGGAGIQADLKTIAAHKLYGMSAITALTAQNTTGVFDVLAVPENFMREQLNCIFSDIRPDAIKIGMIPNKELLLCIAEVLKEQQVEHVVVDPVMASTSGRKLSGEDSGEFFRELFLQASFITPNLPEAERLSGKRIRNREEMEQAAKHLAEKYQAAVLLKGGHFEEGADDYLYDGKKGYWFLGEHIASSNTHGTGCTLSSAIACYLAEGMRMDDAVRNAKHYLTGAIAAGLDLGKGNGPLDHMYAIKKQKI